MLKRRKKGKLSGNCFREPIVAKHLLQEARIKLDGFSYISDSLDYYIGQELIINNT